ncbi:MAG: ComF family protein [Oscillospiraceae bacterium]|jgi:ComF family protein|nr:ComF family protein [Oscillospiraceae bacterium]
MGRALKNLSYIFFPRRCVLCGEVVLPQDELCEQCADYLEHAPAPATYNEIVAPFAYSGAIRAALHQFKFNGNLDSVPFFTKHMADALRGLTDGFEALCFVPLHATRQKSRGYNQSEVLARGLAQRLGLPLRGDLLVRLRDTQSQREFDYMGRQKNVCGAFSVAENTGLNGSRLLLIDDITTTGATLRECMAVLLAAGATEVIGAAVASTPLS